MIYNLLNERNYSNSRNKETITNTIDKFNSGVYLYSIEIDGYKLHAGKINIVK